MLLNTQIPKLCDFLSRQTSELPEILNLSKRFTNLKYNEDSFFSKFAFLHL